MTPCRRACHGAACDDRVFHVFISTCVVTAGLRRLQSDFYASPSRFFTPQADSVADDAISEEVAASSAAAGDATMARNADSWMPAHVAFTAQDKTFFYRTITFNFNDMALPGMLRAAIEVHTDAHSTVSPAHTCLTASSQDRQLCRDIFAALPVYQLASAQSDERLLHLYEGGLPTWAIYAPKVGLPYRPWLRTATWLLFVAVSVFSLLSGFYDLYRHFPAFEQARPATHECAIRGAHVL